MDDPCIVFALRWEARPVLRACKSVRRFRSAPFPLFRCHISASTFLLAEIGVGSQCAPQLEWLLREPVLENAPYRPRFVLSAGYSGGLNEQFHLGDIVLATEVVDQDGHQWPTSWPRAACSFRQGRVLTVPKPACEPEAKRKLGLDHGAVAVDMETALVARICTEHRTPFGCLRVISDAVDRRVPPQMVRCFEGSRLSVWRLLGQLGRSPGLIKDLWWMARDARRASAALTDAIVRLPQDTS